MLRLARAVQHGGVEALPEPRESDAVEDEYEEEYEEDFEEDSEEEQLASTVKAGAPEELVYDDGVYGATGTRDRTSAQMAELQQTLKQLQLYNAEQEAVQESEEALSGTLRAVSARLSPARLSPKPTATRYRQQWPHH